MTNHSDVDSALISGLIRQIIYPPPFPLNLANDGIAACVGDADLADLMTAYLALSPGNAERLGEPGGCLELAVFLTPGATCYAQVLLSGALATASERPIRVLHVGASALELYRSAISSEAYRVLSPDMPHLEHSFVGPEVSSPPLRAGDEGDALFERFFPGLEPEPLEGEFFTGTLSDVFAQSPDFRDEVLSAQYDVAIFSNPGFTAGSGDSWFDCSATREILASPEVRVVGSSQNPVDYALDKVFLESRSRAIRSAGRNTMTAVGRYDQGGRWSDVIWVAGSDPDVCLPPSSVSLNDALDLLEFSSSFSVWNQIQPYSCSPAEFVPGRPNCLWVTPTVILNMDAGVLEFDGGPLGSPFEAEVRQTFFGDLHRGDYWVRLEHICDLMEELEELQEPAEEDLSALIHDLLSG